MNIQKHTAPEPEQETNKLIVKTPLGNIIAEPATDPEYPGIYLSFVKTGDDYSRTLCLVEAEDPDTHTVAMKIWKDEEHHESYDERIEVENGNTIRCAVVMAANNTVIDYAYCNSYKAANLAVLDRVINHLVKEGISVAQHQPQLTEYPDGSIAVVAETENNIIVCTAVLCGTDAPAISSLGQAPSGTLPALRGLSVHEEKAWDGMTADEKLSFYNKYCNEAAACVRAKQLALDLAAKH